MEAVNNSPYLISNTSFEFLYNFLYGLTAFFAFVAAISYDSDRFSAVTHVKNRFFGKITVICFILLIGFRAYNVGADTINYHLFYWVKGYKAESSFEILFLWVLNLIKDWGGTFTMFLFFISILFFYFIYRSFNIVSTHYKANVFWILFCFLSLFFAKSLSINVMRQGLALAFLLYALALWMRKSKPVYILVFVTLGIITHSTSIIPVSIFLVVIILGYKIPLRYFYVLFVLGIMLSALDFGLMNIVPSVKEVLIDAKRANYFDKSDVIYQVGFKPQFVVFNTVFLIYFYHISNKFLKTRSPVQLQYETLLRYYLLSSFIFFLAFQVPYSDRWGLFSWIIIPVMMAPYFTLLKSRVNKVPIVLIFISIYIFFAIYT